MFFFDFSDSKSFAKLLFYFNIVILFHEKKPLSLLSLSTTAHNPLITPFSNARIPAPKTVSFQNNTIVYPSLTVQSSSRNPLLLYSSWLMQMPLVKKPTKHLWSIRKRELKFKEWFLQPADKPYSENIFKPKIVDKKPLFWVLAIYIIYPFQRQGDSQLITHKQQKYRTLEELLPNRTLLVNLLKKGLTDFADWVKKTRKKVCPKRKKRILKGLKNKKKVQKVYFSVYCLIRGS